MEEMMWVRLLEPMINVSTQEFWSEGHLIQLPVAFAIQLVNAGKAVEYHVPGAAMQADSEMSASSTAPVQNRVIKNYVDGRTDWPLMGKTVDLVEIPANARTLVRIPMFEAGTPDTIQAFKAIVVQNSPQDGAGRDHTVIQMFSTADNGKTAQIGLTNLGPEAARVQVQVTVLARRELA